MPSCESGPPLLSAGGKTHRLPHISEKPGSSRALGLLVCGHTLAGTTSALLCVIVLLDTRLKLCLTSSFLVEVSLFLLGLLCICTQGTNNTFSASPVQWHSNLLPGYLLVIQSDSSPPLGDVGFSISSEAV